MYIYLDLRLPYTVNYTNIAKNKAGWAINTNCFFEKQNCIICRKYKHMITIVAG